MSRLAFPVFLDLDTAHREPLRDFVAVLRVLQPDSAEEFPNFLPLRTRHSRVAVGVHLVDTDAAGFKVVRYLHVDHAQLGRALVGVLRHTAVRTVPIARESVLVGFLVAALRVVAVLFAHVSLTGYADSTRPAIGSTANTHWPGVDWAARVSAAKVLYDSVEPFAHTVRWLSGTAAIW